ncbi:hypothetical protein Leryth_001262, partial [Lithospermum erythrorhizon]
RAAVNTVILHPTQVGRREIFLYNYNLWLLHLKFLSCKLMISSNNISIAYQTELISGDQNGNILGWELTANSCS